MEYSLNEKSCSHYLEPTHKYTGCFFLPAVGSKFLNGLGVQHWFAVLCDLNRFFGVAFSL